MNIRQHIHSLIIALVLTLYCQCGSGPDVDGYGQEHPLGPESYAVIDSCMSYMDSDPSRAHRMLDSVCQAGIMSPQRCCYLHAMVVFEGENNTDSALMICSLLLDKAEFGDDHFLEAEICELATNIASGSNRHVEVLQYANRGIPLCHGHERMRNDEASMLGRVGKAYQMLGHTDEARQAYDRALELLVGDCSFGGLISLISLQKKQAALYREAGDYDRVIDVCHAVLDQVNRFERDPSTVDSRPATMDTTGEATHDFADFYQTQMYVRLAGAYRLKVEQGVSVQPQADRDSASLYVGKWLQTAGSHSIRNQAAALRELYFTGHRAEFDAAKRVVGEALQNDSLSHDYHDYLTLMAEDAALRHDLAGSNSYLLRAAVVGDSLYRQEVQIALSEQMSLHKVQEAQLAELDAEHRLSRNRYFTVFLCAILLMGMVINVLFWVNHRRKKSLEAMQQDLEETMEEVHELEQQLEEVKAESTIDNMTALYQRIEQAMALKELYLNPDFDIKKLAEEVGSSRTNISFCINSLTGKPFRLWLSEYRLNRFIQLLKQNPDESIEELMTSCGYQEQSTFRRQFKAAYGMTAGEYRKRLLENSIN